MRAAATGALLLLSGCAGQYGSPWTWDATQVNRQNIAATAEQPADLVQGRGAAGGDAQLAAAAIERLRRGKPRALPTVATSSVAGGSDAAAGGGGSDAPGTAAGAAGSP